jgi:tRNA pseudouridine38-40 synthase
MARFFLKLAYDGTNYHGWQVQENAHTVQAELEEKIGLMLSDKISVTGCGRTDTGVHAREFFAHFDTGKMPFEPKDFVYKLNRFLPVDIAVFDLFEVNPDMHTRFSAVSRTYKYFINTKKNPFNTKYSYYFNGDLDVDAMNRAAKYISKYKDFTSFSKLHTQTATNICKISEAAWEAFNDGRLIFTITADRFLRNMVRAVVGTLIEVGKKRITPEDVKSIIEAKDRSKAGFSVPANGLFLEKIKYPF